MPTDFLASARKQFAYYQLLGEQAMAQISDEQLGWQPSATSNSIATIVQHLAGNMLSRWTDFLTTDGEKPWRAREAEFDHHLRTRAEVLAQRQAGWQCLFAALDALTPADFDQLIYMSIPRGNSAAYNAEKFAQPPHREHFTDEPLSR